jgi:hypothetical protein
VQGDLFHNVGERNKTRRLGHISHVKQLCFPFVDHAVDHAILSRCKAKVRLISGTHISRYSPAKGTVVKLAAYGLCLILFVIPSAVRSSEDLVAKREACRLEARSRIAPKRKIEVDAYRRVVERRAAYVSQCINRSFVARSNVPLPPQRVIGDVRDNDKERVVTSSRKEQRRLSGRTERRKLKITSIRTSKPMKLRGKKVRVSSRRSK